MTGAGLHPDAARLVSGSAARRTQAELLAKTASDSKLSTLAVSKERSAGAHLVDEPGSGRSLRFGGGPDHCPLIRRDHLLRRRFRRVSVYEESCCCTVYLDHNRPIFSRL